MLIPARFNGPPDSGHGGYSCGMVAAFVDGPAQVTLRVPPPLERELAVERSDDGVLVKDGDEVVAEGRRAEVDLEAPPSPGIGRARAANARGLELFREQGHPFPTCLVCGPERDDGFGVFVSEIQEGRFAASWTPDGEGEVAPELVWAAMDCPSAGPAMNLGGDPPCVLARLAVSLDAPVHAGEPHAFAAWPIELDGRKRHTGVALYDAAGTPLARGRALWIELNRR